MNNVIEVSGKYYLHKQHLISLGVSQNTIKKWFLRGSVEKSALIDGVFICIDDIPTPTRSKLPSVEELYAQANTDVKLTNAQLFISYLQDCVKKSAQYVKNYIQDNGVSQEKAKIYSKKRAILEGLINIHNDFSTGNRLKKGYLEPIAHAYRTVAKCNTNDIEVSRIISNCKKLGIDSMVVDNRKGGNNKAFGEDYMYMLTALVSGVNNLSSTQAAKELTKLCKKEGLKAPSISWSEKKAREIEGNIDIYCAKYGLTKAKKLMPYANIINATYADDQYQIDGYNLPFFCRVFDDKGKSSINSVTSH